MAKNATPEAQEAPEKEAQEAPEKEAQEAPEKMVTIILELTKEHKEDVFVRVNQRTWQIKRGEEVTVPECVVEVLNNSRAAQREAMEYETKLENKRKRKAEA